MLDTPNPARPAFAGAGDELDTQGLSKRELIAAMALQGMLANDDEWESYGTPARRAVKAADALLEALEK